MSETTELGFSYEYGVDIYDPAEEQYLPFRFPTGISFTVDPKTAPADTYDDLGAPNERKLSESWTGTFSVQQHRLANGSYLPEVELLKSYTEPDIVGNEAVAKLRWYDKPATGDPNPDDAYEGFATVQLNRGETGNDGIGTWNVTLTGVGRRKQIPNPFEGWGADPEP